MFIILILISILPLTDLDKELRTEVVALRYHTWGIWQWEIDAPISKKGRLQIAKEIWKEGRPKYELPYSESEKSVLYFYDKKHEEFTTHFLKNERTLIPSDILSQSDIKTIQSINKKLKYIRIRILKP